MIPTEVSRARIVVVAISLAIAALAYAVAERSPARTSTAALQADAAREAVEGEVYRTDIPGKLEDALGDAFGGVWFEASTLQLHVGVTSPAGRREAESVVAQAGLAENVTETPVRFSWERLERARERWKPRLADLFARREANIALSADTNAVEINLSASVPSSERAELQREAAADRVNATIDVEPAFRFDVAPAEKCAEFKSKSAGCAPSITSGQTIRDEKTFGCTAGPLLIRKDRSTEAKATETFVLTAGHCMKPTGGTGKAWTALTTTLGEKPLGTSIHYVMPGGLGGIDAGVIKVESVYWAPEEDPPVNAHRAAWSAEKETEPVSVTGSAKPVEGMGSCLSGQRSGVQCGTVTSAEMLVPMEYTKGIGSLLIGMAQVELESGKAGKGDSGAPTFSQAATGVIQGHAVAVALEGGTEEGKVLYFQLLGTTLANLPTEYELLTTANEKRHK